MPPIQPWLTILIFVIPVIGAGVMAWAVLYLQQRFVTKSEWLVRMTHVDTAVDSVRRDGAERVEALSAAVSAAHMRLERQIESFCQDRRTHDIAAQAALTKLQEATGFISGQLSTLTQAHKNSEK